MPLKLPLYLLSGRKPVSVTRTPDGGMIILGWDFEKRQLTVEAGEWDDVVDIQAGIQVQGNTERTEGQTERVTRREFEKAIRRLKAAPS